MLSEQTIISISQKRNEPAWLLDWRLAAFDAWKKMKEPHWAEIDYEPIDYDAMSYYKESAPIADNSDLKKIYEKMNLPEAEQKALLGMATDTVIDSRSVHTGLTSELERLGIIFLPFGEAVEKHPELVQKYLGSVVPATDNFFAALNAAVFSDGTFVYVPPNTKCPIDLASYFRIETAHIGQFERTLIVADTGSELSYLEGCSAPRRPNHQLHSGVVEVIAHDGAAVKYATVQNWYSGKYTARGAQSGGIYNFVTKRGRVERAARLLWTQVEIGSAKTWKYPSSVLAGDYAHSDFYSLSITRGRQQADTGTKMIHLGDNTTSNIVSYGIALEESMQTFRSLVSFAPKTRGAKNASKCDSKIIGDRAVINTYPTIFHGNGGNDQSHEASTGAVPSDALLYLEMAGIDTDEATALIIGGLAAPVLKRLPMEFLVESKQLIQMALSKDN
ncbi:MAG: Fe-S cluster assembly protein SufB [Rickettsiales bacterium]|jgi:Fe-S cluster assembly protein SufB|nr:Fe-S cluster assembly protein SufB [Rickettsiales bacterium]